MTPFVFPTEEFPAVFYVHYALAELRRRSGRTVLTALGLGVGVALVVCVGALSQGLDDAQDEVLEPLTGVGTDMSVTRPIEIRQSSGGGQQFGPGAGLSAKEREQLREENGGARLRLNNLGDPGEKFSNDSFVSTSQLSFPATQVTKIAGLEGAQAAAGGLTLSAIHVEGTVPEDTGQNRFGGPPGTGGGAGGQPPQDLDFQNRTVTGVDPAHPDLGGVTRGQVTKGRWFDADAKPYEAILTESYAKRQDLDVGDTFTMADKTFTVIGLSEPPIGGQSSDTYVELKTLQRLADREGRVNTVYVRADDTDAVAPLSKEISAQFNGAKVTTASDLADRVGGSLVDAKNLSGKLGAALIIIGLLASMAIASLLTLSSVTKRVRELGTLKALGWKQWLVVRQVAGESLAQGALGGVAGVVLGVGGAALISMFGPTLEASVADQAQSAAGGPPGLGGAFGSGAITSGKTSVSLDAPVDPKLIALAVGLALLGGLLAGAVGGLRASRLRPADALRHID